MIVPAGRRALPIWLGAAIVGTVIFGGTGMQPHDLTRLALEDPGVGAVLAATWLLVFLPTARLIVRADGARYLRSLPSPRFRPTLLAVAALVGFQLPWLVLWLVGARGEGVLVIAVITAAVAVLALWRARPRRVGSPRWHSSGAALRGIYARALRRRATDALVRAAGLAALAGIAASLFVRNNELAGVAAGVLATSVIAIVLVPGWAGALLPLVETHRTTAWLARSLGVSERARVAALAIAVAVLYAITTALAAATSFILVPDAGVWIAAIAVPTSLVMSIVVTRLLLWADRSEVATAARIIVGAIVASALAVIALGFL